MKVFPPFLGSKECLTNVYEMWTAPRRLYFCYLGNFKSNSKPDDCYSASASTFRDKMAKNSHFPLLPGQKQCLEMRNKIWATPRWL